MESPREKAHRIYNEFLNIQCMREDREGSLKKAYAAGMIPKSEYVVGQTYIGHCRNQEEAVWDGEKFEYQRTKFGHTFPDHVECPEDERGFDIFVPVEVKDA